MDDMVREALPPEEREAFDRRMEELGKIASLSGTLAKSRDSAINARQNSGIEEDWLEDEEYYEGIDDANRDLHRSRSKPLSSEGGTENKKVSAEVRSRVFLNITRPYVDAAAAKVADMLLPTDDQNWGIEPTPIPSLVKHKDDATPVVDPATYAPMMTQEQGKDGQMQQRQMTVADQVKQIFAQAKEAAKSAETRIDDWLSECNYNNETRKCIEYAARLGTGIIKGPYPVERNHRAVSKQNGIVSIVQEVVIGPESKAINPWNFYPDANCGNNIHNGSHTWEKDNITAKGLHELLEDSSYIRENLESVLREGPQKKYAEDKGSSDKNTFQIDEKDLYQIWYFYGFLGREEMETMGCECGEFEQVPAVVIMVNDTIIKAYLNPNEDGCFPYDVMCWQARDDFWAGIGVSRQIRTPQRMLNAASRQMMDNAGISAGPQIVVRRGVVEPLDGSWTITPRKVWTIDAEWEGTGKAAFEAVQIESIQNDLMAIIQFAIKMAEDVTGLPMLLQGQQGKAPETVGGMQMLNNNASTVLRRIARTFDDCVTEPHIRRYYDWLLQDEDVPDNEKGDFKIVARGSSALVERDIQNQNIAAQAAMVNNPAFGINPRKWYAEYCRSQRLAPETFQYTEEEQKQIDERMAQQKDPRIAAAEIAANAAIQKAQAEAQDRQAEREFQLQLKQMERDIEAMKLAAAQKISLDKVKAQLAGTAMKIKNDREMQNQEVAVKEQQGSGI